MNRVIAIDPGTYESALLVFRPAERKITQPLFASNEFMVQFLQIVTTEPDTVAIEMIASYGMPVGRETFETCLWIGRFIQAIAPHPVRLITRNEVKMALCHQIKGVNDAVIAQRLRDLLGGKGTKKAPGPLYGITKHLWSALAVAVTAAGTTTTTGENL